MAIISCPNCGKQISDKALKCLHCGYKLVAEEKKVCAECGTELLEDAVECPVCGCPVNVETANPQQVEVTGVKISKKSKKIVIGVIAIIFIAAIAIVGVSQLNKQNAAKSYGENLELITYTMLSGASDAESCGNLIKQVWYNAIYEERDSETDPYTRPNGYFVSDFNEALQNLFSDESFTDQIESIEDNQSTVQSLMKEMRNPPDEYEDAYEALSELYDAYINLTNLVTSPSGSLQTFSNDFNDADSETANCYNAMSLYLE